MPFLSGLSFRSSSKTEESVTPSVVQIKEESLEVQQDGFDDLTFLDDDDDVVIIEDPPPASGDKVKEQSQTESRSVPPTNEASNQGGIEIKKELTNGDNDDLSMEGISVAANDNSPRVTSNGQNSTDTKLECTEQKWFKQFIHDQQTMIFDRHFKEENFDERTPVRSTQLVVGTVPDERTFFISLDFMAEMSEYFRKLKYENRQSVRGIRIRIKDEKPDDFLMFLRALIPCPLPLQVDEFNVAVLSEFSFTYGAWHLQAQCEKYMCDNISILEEDLICRVFRSVFSKNPKEKTWLYSRLFQYVADNLSFDQFDTFRDLDVELTLSLYQKRSRSLATQANNLQRELVIHTIEDDEPEAAVMRNGRKRAGTRAVEVPNKKLKPEKTIACPRCISGARAANPFHGVQYMQLRCVMCKRMRCGQLCPYGSTCKEGSSCVDARPQPQAPMEAQGVRSILVRPDFVGPMSPTSSNSTRSISSNTASTAIEPHENPQPTPTAADPGNLARMLNIGEALRNLGAPPVFPEVFGRGGTGIVPAAKRGGSGRGRGRGNAINTSMQQRLNQNATAMGIVVPYLGGTQPLPSRAQYPPYTPRGRPPGSTNKPSTVPRQTDKARKEREDGDN